jgi:succinyl-CoA synthetase beta subunit
VKIHEYQAKAVLARFGVPVPRGEVAYNADEAVAIAQRLGLPVVVKAQIHAGGRGKGGGVKVAKTMEEVERLSAAIIGMKLVTHQTGPEGKIVQRVLIEQGVQIVRELYLAIVLDRATGRPVIMASSSGGMDIEKVAAETPHLLFKEYIHPTAGLEAYQSKKLAFALELTGPAVAQCGKLVSALYEAFKATDASLVEINPLIVTGEGNLQALDAKMNFDDNALYRHPELKELRDLSEEDPLESEASKFSLNYIRLDGTIGCMVNGAGLAMTTMDLVNRAGGQPANFLDIGGGAKADRVAAAMRLILEDPNVKAILVNIFGGITRGDEVAKGLIEARAQQVRDVPMVVRIVGTNAAEAAELLEAARFVTADSLDEAAAKAVAAAKGAAA